MPTRNPSHLFTRVYFSLVTRISLVLDDILKDASGKFARSLPDCTCVPQEFLVEKKKTAGAGGAREMGRGVGTQVDACRRILTYADVR